MLWEIWAIDDNQVEDVIEWEKQLVRTWTWRDYCHDPNVAPDYFFFCSPPFVLLLSPPFVPKLDYPLFTHPCWLTMYTSDSS